MKSVTEQYLDIVDAVLTQGEFRDDRTTMGAHSIFGNFGIEVDLAGGHLGEPMCRKHAVRSVIGELFWFMSGVENVEYLHAYGVRWWDSYVDPNAPGSVVEKLSNEEYVAAVSEWEKLPGNNVRGAVPWDLPPDYPLDYKVVSGWLPLMYSHQMRNLEGVDQLTTIIDQLRSNPNSRRHLINFWNVRDVPAMPLPPCVNQVQLFVRNGILDCKIYQRSCDVIKGLPHNLVEWSYFTHWLANEVGMTPGKLFWTGGDVHIYANDIASAASMALECTGKINMAAMVDFDVSVGCEAADVLTIGRCRTTLPESYKFPTLAEIELGKAELPKIRRTEGCEHFHFNGQFGSMAR